MKKIISLILFISSFYPTLSVAQSNYRTLDFEQTNLDKKMVFQFQSENTGDSIHIDTTTAASGKSSLFMQRRNKNSNGGAYLYILLPKAYYADLRNISVSSQIRMPTSKPCAGIWCMIKKDKETLGRAATYQIPYRFSPFFSNHRTMVPPIPYSWMPYNFELEVDEDPTEVIIGIFVPSGFAWFDDLKIKVNGKPIDEMVFQITEVK